jgi:hypothetical protein
MVRHLDCFLLYPSSQAQDRRLGGVLFTVHVGPGGVSCLNLQEASGGCLTTGLVTLERTTRYSVARIVFLPI